MRTELTVVEAFRVREKRQRLVVVKNDVILVRVIVIPSPKPYTWRTCALSAKAILAERNVHLPCLV